VNHLSISGRFTAFNNLNSRQSIIAATAVIPSGIVCGSPIISHGKPFAQSNL